MVITNKIISQAIIRVLPKDLQVHIPTKGSLSSASNSSSSETNSHSISVSHLTIQEPIAITFKEEVQPLLNIAATISRLIFKLVISIIRASSVRGLNIKVTIMGAI